MSRKTRWIFAVSALLSLAVPALAQQPSQEQISAIRGACRGDYMSVCASVPTGGSAALQCLKQHSADVSGGCRDALAAVGGSPPPPPPPPVTTATAASNPQLPQPLPPDFIANQAAAQSTWPHTITREGATVTVYQPQAVQWPDHQTLTARAAIAIVQPGQSKPVLGSIELTLATQTDDATGIVHLSDPKLLNSHFPSLDTQQAQDLQAKIGADLPTMETHQAPLSAILLSLGQPPIASVPVSNDPPEIFAADHPASLVVFDGDPVLVPVGTTGLSVAVNTNWDVFVDQSTWYLLNGGVWFSAPQRDGPYAVAAQLPPEFTNLPNDGNFANVRKSIPARPVAAGYRAPQIFVSTKPAEIIVTDGAPAFQPVTGTTLQRVTNTSSVLYFDPGPSNFYVQLSGRWFSANALAGPWEYATDNLPPDFALIPPDGPDAAILPSVPGTVAAQEAVLQAQIPTTTTVQRKSAALTVVWSGPPRFAPIPGTSIEAAVNTNVEMLKIGSAYYVCDKGIWYVGTTPNGPWALADRHSAVAVRKIPPRSPHYHLAYAQIYAATATAVTYGYTAGYLMGYVSSGVLVYGTGYYYPPVVIAGATPIYYPYPYTYAGSVWYNSNTGAWARGGAVYGPNGGVARGGTYYNPTTGAYAAGGAVYGPNGGAGAWSAYNPSTGSYAHGSASWSNGTGSANGSYYNARTGVSGSTNQNWTPYGRNGSSTFSGPNQTVNTKSGANSNGRAGGFSSTTGAEGAGYHNNVTGNNGGAVKTQNGDVYAGHDGNVYRNTGSGWQKYDNGSWNSVQPPDRNTDNSNSRNNNNTNTAGNNTNTASNSNTLGSSNNSNTPSSTNNTSNNRNSNQNSTNNTSNNRNSNQTSGNQASNNRNSNQNSGANASNNRNNNQSSGNQASNNRNNINQQHEQCEKRALGFEFGLAPALQQGPSPTAATKWKAVITSSWSRTVSAGNLAVAGAAAASAGA